MVTVMQGCPNCLALERKVAGLEDQLASLGRMSGLRASVGKVVAVMDALGVEPAQARILIRLCRAGTRYTPTAALVDEMRNPDADPGAIRTQVCRIRRLLGDKSFIETNPGRIGAYRLSPAAREWVGATLAGAAP